MIKDDDLIFLRQAMQLAQQGEGSVNPNPMVGALIVQDGQVIARGYHARYGGLHAERNAFRDAEERGVTCGGATMYVTLEPCCHHGKQPPCTDAVIAHHISRVVIGLLDPNPLVAGKGIVILQQAGIEVDVLDQTSALANELRFQNRVFLKYITTRRPWIVSKYAMTLDGKISSRTGDSRWVSGEASRHCVHLLRRNLTAILCGIGTVLADDPMLNTRLADQPDARNPIRIVADRHLRIPMDSALVRTACQFPTIVVHASLADADRISALHLAGVQTWCCDTLADLVQKAGEEHIDSILLEGGGTLNEAFLHEGLIDEVYAFIAPKLIGGADAKTPVEGQGFELMSQAVRLTDVHTEMIEEDILIRGIIKHHK